MGTHQTTIQDHQDRMNRVLVHIQEHLEEPIDLQKLADIACYSAYHFHRIFAAYTGEPLNTHLRRLRLERAASRLLFTKHPVTEIGYEAGYGTPAAFAKAFRTYFSLTPSEFRERGVAPEKSSDLPINKEKKMKCDIRELGPQDVYFVRKQGTYSECAPEAWGGIMKFAYSNRIMKKETLMYGVCHDNPDITAGERLRYDACITYSGDIKPEGEVGMQTLAGGRYAVFLHKGPYENFKDTYAHIFNTWLPQSGEELRNTPCFERYLNRDPRKTKPENLKTEIFVPLN